MCYFLFIQYPTDQSRPWPPPTGPGGQTAHGHAPHQHPPSPQHHVTAQSPVHAPSPSPQPPQPSNSPHQVNKQIKPNTTKLLYENKKTVVSFPYVQDDIAMLIAKETWIFAFD